MNVPFSTPVAMARRNCVFWAFPISMWYWLSTYLWGKGGPLAVGEKRVAETLTFWSEDGKRRYEPRLGERWWTPIHVCEQRGQQVFPKRDGCDAENCNHCGRSCRIRRAWWAQRQTCLYLNSHARSQTKFIEQRNSKSRYTQWSSRSTSGEKIQRGSEKTSWLPF